MSDVFVSYKAEDRRRVHPLVNALEAEGLSVWWDAQIGGGTAWRQSIERELNAIIVRKLREADIVLVSDYDKGVCTAGVMATAKSSTDRPPP